MHAGPVWDFDYYTYQPYYQDKLINMNAVWNSRIINDPASHPIVKQRWNMHRDQLRAIIDEIDRQYLSIKESAEYNAQLWPLNLNLTPDDNKNKEANMSVEEAVNRIKSYYEHKFNWMDSYINTNF
jgi:hypothetical protein